MDVLLFHLQHKCFKDHLNIEKVIFIHEVPSNGLQS